MASIISTLVQVHIARRRQNHWQYLALRRSDTDPQYPNLWQCLTGTIGEGESAIQAAQRELQEETHLTPIEWWSIPIIAYYYSQYEDALVFVPVFGVYVKGECHLTEHAAYRWLSLKRACQLLSIPAQREGTQMFAYLLTKQEHQPVLRRLYYISG